jgi:arginyl-tRNA synthetase
VSSQSHKIVEINPKEKEIIKQLLSYPEIIQQGAKQYSPALIANYTYDLVKLFNSFYQNVPILGGDDKELETFRLSLCSEVAKVIQSGLGLLGMEVPERM